MSILPGVYSWTYANGSFLVSLRPNFVFHCQSYPSVSSWAVEGDAVLITWGKYGNYRLSTVNEGELEGSLDTDPSQWRKMKFVRSFTDAENLMMGDGGGSVWSFEWEKGSFEIEFLADGFNHFNCGTFPEHSHWFMEEDKVEIRWGRYGDYVLEVDGTSRTMTGSKKNQPSNWRRATFLRALGIEALQEAPAHDHSHHHEHNEHCNHDH